MALDNAFIDELKARANIVEVIGRELPLKKAGSNYKGLCPFHQEKTPSFMVNEERQIYVCFGCGEKGDVIHFLQRYHHLSFMEACERLADEYGLAMPTGGHRPKVDYDHYYEINRIAARFFLDQLTRHPNQGYPYIHGRGIEDESIRRYGLGYAPDSWDALYNHLRGQGISEEDMLTLGLVVRGKRGCYDKFRRRVIFPIFNVRGNVIGFGGRALGSEMPKYLNSAESAVFAKKNNLYGLNFAKRSIADADQALLVEGYMDALSLWQSGIPGVVASLGTALTENQARLLTRYSKNIVLSYDADTAGVRAALRGIEILRTAGGRVKILRIDGGKDPDEYVRRYGKEAFLHLVETALPATDFQLDVLREDYDLSDARQAIEYIRRCVPVLAGLDAIEQDAYIRKLAAEFGISDQAIRMEVAGGADRQDAALRTLRRRYARRDRSDRAPDAALRLELSLLLLSTRDLRYLQRMQADGIVFRTAIGQKSYRVLRELAGELRSDSDVLTLDAWMRALEPDEEAACRRILAEIRIGPDEEVHYGACRTAYRLNAYEERRVELLNELSVAEQMAEEEDISRITAALMEVEESMREVKESQYA